MAHNTVKKLGSALIVCASIAYTSFRLITLVENYSVVSLIAAVCEISALTLISIESVLLAAQSTRPVRRQDANVLIESAKKVLFTSSQTTESSDGSTKVDTATQTVTGSYDATPVDVCVLAEDATYEELRRCFLSLNLVDDIDHVYVVGVTGAQYEGLCDEFGFHKIETLASLTATTSSVLVCRGTDILYPDATKIGRTYDVGDSTFLELRSVYSNENILGENGLVEIVEKRQMIRESLSTRGLATWSAGPALVPASAIEAGADAANAEQFFLNCERAGIHGMITEEIVSEEISYEQTISEVQWRALDVRYTSRAWRNSYTAGSRTLGFLVKAWSVLISTSFVRRIVAIALVLAFVLNPGQFEFVTKSFIGAGCAAVLAILTGGYLNGDRRGIASRVREFYLDVEAAMYNVYKSVIPVDHKSSDRSIVKKLPSVSFLLILADAILVYRVIQQDHISSAATVTNLLKNISLFSGYLLIVSLLVGLGMVIVRQARTALRREISRGANVNTEPVSMIDLSPGGAGIISVSPLEVDTQVRFESSLPAGEGNVKFSCAALVRSCVEWNGSYRVGLSFIDMDQSRLDILETYCSIIYPHVQAREQLSTDRVRSVKTKINGKVEKRFLSYAASFIALGAIIYTNLSSWWQ